MIFLIKNTQKDEALTQSYLNCTYTAHHPFFLIGPLKLEVLSLSPYVCVYHDIINDNQAKHLKSFFALSMVPTVIYS